MARYFFNTYDSVTRIDAEGADFETWEEARKEAIGAASEVLKFHPQRLIAGDDWRLEVTDARGFVLLRLDFLITESPTMQSAGRTKNPC